MMVNRDMLREAARMILEAIGEDPDRPGLIDTPRRFANAWAEFIEYEPGRFTTFDSDSDQLIAVAGIRVWSMCEHHLLPFRVDLSIGYIPHGRLLGLSKFARMAQECAHRLNVQELLCEVVATSVMDFTGSPDVAVVGRGEHLCLTMRGARQPASMMTSVMRGVFRDKPEARAEFLRLTDGGT